MRDSNNHNSRLSKKKHDKEKFKAYVKKAFELTKRYVYSSEEFQEDIKDYNEIYEVCLRDIDFTFRLEIFEGTVIYKEGTSKKSALRVELTTDLMKKIFKKEISASDAYMRGIIKFQGSITEAFKFNNFFNLGFKYFKKITKKK
ncbi:MAG: SCP2 sterol-binding domain-containing protein [Promethearchaeota archaeon]